jgi:hypothetical protein
MHGEVNDWQSPCDANIDVAPCGANGGGCGATTRSTLVVIDEAEHEGDEAATSVHPASPKAGAGARAARRMTAVRTTAAIRAMKFL